MSVLIKNMSMPKGCMECDLWLKTSEIAGVCAKLCRVVKIEPRYARGRRRDCPLTEVPAPHGKLIDADELIGYLNERLSDPVALSGFTRIINHQPTIIEAEVSNNA